jgi:hypothetical protein
VLDREYFLAAAQAGAQRSGARSEITSFHLFAFIKMQTKLQRSEGKFPNFSLL